MKKNTNAKQLPLIVIVGPTASGKTDLAIRLAKKYNGEIICADSRTIYKGMDIGTAKPTKNEQRNVRHWGIDLVYPDEKFSAADFKIYADNKITEIRSRGHIPFLVGGTGLYIDSVVFDYEFSNPVNDEIRKKLQHLTIEELYEYCDKNNISLPENKKNKRYVLRSIESNGIKSNKLLAPIKNSIIVGIATDKDVLLSKIKNRIEKMLDCGVIKETENLLKKYNEECEAMKSNIYSVIKLYLDKKIMFDAVKEKATVADWHLVKKQKTWFKRNNFIHWLSASDAEKYLSDILAINN